MTISSRCIDVTQPHGWQAAIERAGLVTAAGQLLVLPTDTVYGVGTSPLSKPAVERLLAAKGRGGDQPSPVLVGEIADLAALGVELTDELLRLTTALWPGALTFIVATTSAVARNLGAATDTIAVRMPDHSFTRELLRATGPLAVSSANRTGEPPATSCPLAQAALGDAVQLYLDGGTTPGPTPSTIVDVTASAARVLRWGGVDERALRSAGLRLEGER